MPKLTKEQWNMILSAVLAFVVAIATAFGYNIVAVQPQIARSGPASTSSAGPASAGPTSAGSVEPQVMPTAVLGQYFDSMTVGKSMKSLGSASFSTATVTDLTGTTITATTLISTAVGFDTTGDGTAAAPAYTFSSDADTGIYRAASNDLGIATGGTKAFGVGAASVTSTLPFVVNSNATVTGTLTASGATALNGGLTMDTSKFTVADTSGNTSIAGTLTVDNNALVTGTLTVSGTTSLVGEAATTAGLAVGGNLTVTGATALNGGLAMDTNKFTVADTSGNTSIAGTLTVSGTQSLVGDTTASGYVTATTGLAIGTSQFSGAVRYGTAATYAHDAVITHGFATTPTVCLIWPAEVTATVTITSTSFSSDTANHTSPVYWMCGK